MHTSSLENMKKALDQYVGVDYFNVRRRTVVDIGSYSVNGSYRQLFDPRIVKYVGLDLAPGEGVDVILDSPYRFPLEDGAADLVISGQMLEHSEYFWDAFREMTRILAPDGYLILIAPSSGPIHRYPVDCYRFYPDAYRALARMAGCHVVALWRDERQPWCDLVGVFSRREDEKDKKPILPASDTLPVGEGNAEKHCYEYDVDLESNSTAARIIRLVGSGRKVLELGPGPGSITRYLKHPNNCLITAVELDAEASEKVHPYCDHLVRADLNSTEWPCLIEPSERFDTILAADVLEHVYDPLTVLSEAARFLSEEGEVVVSLPHAGHVTVLASLLNENFEYRNRGLLDRTHIRFFGVKDVQALFERAGMKIVAAQFVTLLPEQTELAGQWALLSPEAKKTLLSNPFGIVYQVIVKAVPTDRAGEPLSLMTMPVVQADLEAYLDALTLPDLERHRAALIEADRRALLGEREAAEQIYRDELAVNPAGGLIWLRLLRGRQQASLSEGLLELADSAVSHCPDHPELLMFCAELNRQQGNTAAAIVQAQRVTGLAPELVQPWAFTGNLLMADGRFEEAIPYLKRAVQLRNETEFWLMAGLGDALLRSGQEQEGQSWLDKSLALAPEDKAANVQHRYAQALMARGKLEQALPRLQAAVAQSGNPGFHVAYANLLLRLGQGPRARQHLLDAQSRSINAPQIEKMLERLMPQR